MEGALKEMRVDARVCRAGRRGWVRVHLRAQPQGPLLRQVYLPRGASEDSPLSSAGGPHPRAGVSLRSGSSVHRDAGPSVFCVFSRQRIRADWSFPRLSLSQYLKCLVPDYEES